LFRALAPLCLAATIGTAAAAAGPVLNIYIASDSTAQTYKPDHYPQTGWGQMLPCAFATNVVIHNEAIAGRSTRSFIDEGRLDHIRQELKSGDTLLIQFGHNDADTKKPGRYAAPAGAYHDNLARIVEMARAAGAQPVLITPVTRRHFENGEVKADFADWSNQMRLVARDLKVPLIDLEAKSRDWVKRAGPEASIRYYLHYKPEDKIAAFPNGIDDDTHFSELGARGVAEIIARELRALKLPISRRVLRARPALTRTEPLGSTACN
jgi:lysophospholipase L1-like esterase